MRLGQLARDCQAEAGAFRPSGDERFEQMLRHVRRDAAASIGNRRFRRLTPSRFSLPVGDVGETLIAGPTGAQSTRQPLARAGPIQPTLVAAASAKSP